MTEPAIPQILWTDIVRRTRHESVVQSDPLDSQESFGVSVEWIDTVGFDRRYVALVHRAEDALVIRREIRVRGVQDQARSVPDWEGEMPVSLQLFRWEMRQLEKLDLWGLKDFPLRPGILDGEWYVVRARDPHRGLYRDACLYCPDMSESRSLRKLGSRLDRIVGMGQRRFRFRSRLFALLPFS